MKIGERISVLRKKNGLTQDDFAQRFHVTRQTVSNWENGKSDPDLAMIVRIGEEFQISLDELLKEDAAVVRRIDGEKRKKNFLLIVICVVLAAAAVGGLLAWRSVRARNAVAFTMAQSKNYQQDELRDGAVNVATGYFVVPASQKLTVRASGDTDDGTMHIKISRGKTICYRMDAQSVRDTQTLYFPKGSYRIDVTVDDCTPKYRELSLDYSIGVKTGGAVKKAAHPAARLPSRLGARPVRRTA